MFCDCNHLRVTPYRDLFCGGKGHQDHHRGPTPREIQYDSTVPVDEVDVLRCLLLLLNIGSRLLFIIDGIVILLNDCNLFKSESEN